MELSYPTDMSDEQWELLMPLLPAAKVNGRPRSVDLRAVINAIFYIVVAGCKRADVATRVSEVENGLSLLSSVAAGRHLGENACSVGAMGAGGSRASSSP